MLDVGVAEPKLQPPGVMAGIGQKVSASVSQHVRVHVRQSRSITGCADHLGGVRARHRTATLAREHKRRLWLLIAPKLTKGSQFVTLNGVN